VVFTHNIITLVFTFLRRGAKSESENLKPLATDHLLNTIYKLPFIIIIVTMRAVTRGPKKAVAAPAVTAATAAEAATAATAAVIPHKGAQAAKAASAAVIPRNGCGLT
jgi:ABC-type methionine transport system permease subunit